jgi:uncharacterized phage protein gp47/JayE
MSFTPRKYKDIFDEMRAMSQVVTDFEVGSVARTMYESFAYEMALLYEKMQLVYMSAYVDTATGNQLDQVVAVLGITRSQPDFAEGVVTFLREGAGQEILIPIGTLVATEESSTGEKKVYKTSKVATLAANRTSVEVQIRAVERGEEMESAADTVVVMPRPVPGIKFVNNEAPIRLVGKRRETDEELRERAKNTLISSGKATIISIENALLSLSGVRDARVRENFHFPRALVDISNDIQFAQTVTIPRGTVLTANIQGQDHRFKTLDPVAFHDTDAAFISKEVKVESFIEGRSGEVELIAMGPALFENASDFPDLSATINTSLKLEDFGLIEVFVDAPRLDEGTIQEIQEERTRIEAEIEKVRAAGIFSILRPAGKVVTSGVFLIDIAPSLSLTPEERREFESTVEDEIVSYMADLRMGTAMLYGKLIKAILSLENIENISDFQGTVTRKVLEEYIEVIFEFADKNKFIAVEEFERIKSRHICVASEDKDLPVHIAYQASNLDANAAASVSGALDAFFAGKSIGDAILQSEIQTTIDDALDVLVPAWAADPTTLELRPESWCPGPIDDPRVLLEDFLTDKRVVVTYVEKSVSGTIFGYAERLEITGAIKLILPLNVSEADRTTAENLVADAFDAYLRALGPEEDIVFAEVIALAAAVPQVLAAEVEADDFLAYLGGLVQPTIIDDEKIDVGPQARSFAQFMAIVGATEQVVVSSQGLSIQMGNPAATGPEQVSVQTAVRNAFNNALAGFAPGDDVEYASFRGSLENLVVSIPYNITQLDLQALSNADSRTQVATLGTPSDVHIRTVELAVISPIQNSDIIITV